MRVHHLTMAVDLAWVALSAILAVFIRDNFVPWEQHLDAVTAYAAIAVAISAIVFSIAAIHKPLWQYTSLPDVIRILTAVTVALLLAVFISFIASRLEGVPRSIPVIQWFLLVSAMVGTRMGVRLWKEQTRHDRVAQPHADVEHVLVVGVSHLTELFLESVAEYASKKVEIVGILSEQPELHGRLLRFHKVLGTPDELPQVMAELEVHGVVLERVVVMQPFEHLSRRASEALLAVEKASSVKVDWIAELLGLTVGRGSNDDSIKALQGSPLQRSPSEEKSQGSSLSYRFLKRATDVLGTIVLSVLLLPLIVTVAVLVALDVGFPVVFWQKRPGRFGRPFKLFKFCTMRAAHDGEGRRIADEKRSSVVGRFLRRTRIDEIPQLYNILVGEMSFVGPRPLLRVDQPIEMSARLLVRPGLTGLAQVYGTRDMSPDDKNALDIWYVRHASLWLDVKILLRTPNVMMRVERVDHHVLRNALRAARAGLEPLKTQRGTATPDSYALQSKRVVGDGQVDIIHPAA
jgi:lipopolysaccharide/colanic/teichoic acid biosynthesis glycosyltransferase